MTAKTQLWDLENRPVLVVGLGARGRAACDLLHGSGARVMAVDMSDTAELRQEAERLGPLGVEVALGVTRAPERNFALAVVSPAVPEDAPLLRELRERQVPVISEVELGFQQSQCLNIAIAGTNGKATTAGLIERVLTRNHRHVAVCGHGARPVCAVAPHSKDLDFLILNVNSFQLETTEYFRPSVAVLLNLAPDHLDRYASREDYARANGRLFRNQQAFDWAIVQSEALAELKALGMAPNGKVITFSARDKDADLYLDRGLLISRLEDWSWPLLDLDECQLRGPHNAENLMAALAVGHVVRLPLEAMTDALKTAPVSPHCGELVAEIDGVKFINDSKATTVDALMQALRSAPGAPGSRPNVWVIAGGKDKGLDFHDAGPLLSQRARGAFLMGEARDKIRAAWSLFTPCTCVGSLLEAVMEAAKHAVANDVILLSPACSSFDQFRNYQQRGEMFREIVASLGTRAPKREGVTPDRNLNPASISQT